MSFKEDFWTLDGAKVFSYLPGKLLDCDSPIPVCLQRGDSKWGSVHIGLKHAPFVIQHSIGAPQGHNVPWVIWKKLQQSGSIWTSEDQGKLKVSLPLSPSSLLVLKLNENAEPFFGITTLYTHSRGVDGKHAGRYIGRKWPPNVSPPAFYLPPLRR